MNSRRHWITSSAVANSVSGMVRPRALAVLRLKSLPERVGRGFRLGTGQDVRPECCAYHAVRKELIRICGPRAMALMTFQPCFLAVKMNGRWREFAAILVLMYASGDRRNDVYGRMRTIASRLTLAEIDGLAAYYRAGFR